MQFCDDISVVDFDQWTGLLVEICIFAVSPCFTFFHYFDAKRENRTKMEGEEGLLLPGMDGKECI